MTRPTRRTSRSTATIQPRGTVDGWGRPTGATPLPYDVKCTYEINTSKTFVNNAGETFTPKSIVTYEMTEQSTPSEGDTLIITSVTPQVSLEIKAVDVDDPAVVRGKPDIRLATQ